MSCTSCGVSMISAVIKVSKYTYLLTYLFTCLVSGKQLRYFATTAKGGPTLAAEAFGRGHGVISIDTW